MNKKLIQKAKYPVMTFKQKIKMQRGRFGHRPRNDPHYYNGTYPFIQTGNVVKASESNEKIEYTQTLNELGLSTSRLFDEKVLVITIAANIGYTAILDYTACFPDSLVALTLKDSALSLEYLNIYIRMIRQYIENLAPQAAQKNINLKQLGKLPLIVPDKDIQQKIVSIMESAYLKKNQLKKESQALLESIDMYLLQELGIKSSIEENTIQSRIFYTSSNKVLGNRFDPNYYEGEHEFNAVISTSKFLICNFRQLIRSITNGIEIRKYSKKGFRYLRVSDMSKHGIVNKNARYVDVDNIPSKIKLTANDLLISRSGSLGLIEVVTDEIVDSILSSHIFRIQLLHSVNEYYIQEFLRSSLGQYQIFKLNNGGIIPEITQNALGRIKICIPPKTKQDEIANHLMQLRARSKELLYKANNDIAIAQEEVKKILLGDKL